MLNFATLLANWLFSGFVQGIGFPVWKDRGANVEGHVVAELWLGG